MQIDLCVVAIFTEIEAPMSAMHDKHFGSIMTMLGIHAARWLPRPANIIAMRLGYVNMLIGIFGNAGSDNCKIFLRL